MQTPELNLIRNLLSRNPITVDLEPAEKLLTGKAVLVTGAAGSIGSGICRMLVEFDLQSLIALDRNSSGLATLQNDLAGKTKCKIILSDADVRDRMEIERIIQQHEPQCIFHAAASKHVPAMESKIRECVENNVFGLLELFRAAAVGQCEKLVLISSDKAVNPRSVVGVTKRIGELIIACRRSENLRTFSVRLGNVLGSSGSVLPILEDQLQRQEAMTITHRDATRYFLVLEEAVKLILAASAIAEPGDTMVLDMGEPVRILDLASRLAQTHKPERPVVEFVGLRNGEKLHEELFYSHEEPEPTDISGILRVRNDTNGWPQLEGRLNDLRDAVSGESETDVRERLRTIVPQYTWSK